MNKIIIVYVFLIVGSLLQAQSAIRSSVIGNGGSQMSSSAFKLAGTIGQAIINNTQSATTINAQGFWTGYQQRIVKVVDGVNENIIQVELFPNPIREKATLILELDRGQEFRIEVINDLGIKKLVYEKYRASEGKSTLQLSLENLHCGIYFLHVFNSEFLKVIPFSKMH